MKPRLTGFGILVMLLAAGCSSSRVTADQQQLSSDQLKQMVNTRLRADASIGRLGLDVDADGQRKAVQLKGLAYSERQRLRAVELVKEVAPNVSVVDKIDVKPYAVPKDLFDDEMMKDAKADAEKAGDKMGTAVDDAWIHTKIVAKMIADSKTPERKINVDVMDKVVTLRGDVVSREARDEAEKIASSVDGVAKINNRLQVRP